MKFCNKIYSTCEIYNYELKLINIVNCMQLWIFAIKLITNVKYINMNLIDNFIGYIGITFVMYQNFEIW
jgi:hypothetical protein